MKNKKCLGILGISIISLILTGCGKSNSLTCAIDENKVTKITAYFEYNKDKTEIERAELRLAVDISKVDFEKLEYDGTKQEWLEEAKSEWLYGCEGEGLLNCKVTEETEDGFVIVGEGNLDELEDNFDLIGLNKKMPLDENKQAWERQEFTCEQ